MRTKNAIARVWLALGVLLIGMGGSGCVEAARDGFLDGISTGVSGVVVAAFDLLVQQTEAQ